MNKAGSKGFAFGVAGAAAAQASVYNALVRVHSPRLYPVRHARPGSWLVALELLGTLACGGGKGGRETDAGRSRDAGRDAGRDAAKDAEGDADSNGDTDTDTDSDTDTVSETDSGTEVDAGADSGDDAGPCDPGQPCIPWTCGGTYPSCNACRGCDPRPEGDPDPCNGLRESACADAEACEPIVLGDCRGCPNDTYLGCETTCERVSLEGCLMLSHCQVGQPDRCIRRDRGCEPEEAESCYEGYTCRSYPDDAQAGVCIPE